MLKYDVRCDKIQESERFNGQVAWRILWCNFGHLNN